MTEPTKPPTPVPTSLYDLVLNDLEVRLRAHQAFQEQVVDDILSALRSGPRRLTSKLEEALEPREGPKDEAH